MKRKFTKMHGCGNDYIYFNCLQEEITNPEELSIRLADRHFGVGGDGIILICPSDVAHAKMRMFNADGSEGKMCGNAIRCVGRYLYDNNIVDSETIEIDTLSGVKTLKLNKDTMEFTVDMGAPIITAKDVPVISDSETVIKAPLTVDGVDYEITCVSMGNPHCVIFVDDVKGLDLEKIGPSFEHHAMFPERINTEFVRVISPTELEMRVWERGSGETLACGTGTCATVVAATLAGFCEKNTVVTVHLIGGDLTILYTDDTVYMTGKAQAVFDGEVEV